MSAREQLIRFAKHNEPNDGTGVPIDPETGHMVMDIEAHVAGLLDAFAREMAEQRNAEVQGLMQQREGLAQAVRGQAETIGRLQAEAKQMRYELDWRRRQMSAGPVRPDEETTT
ncbi:hypothetical protein [Streptomyces sp. NPDC008240]|uniref:hypothetical protein n=1 Tax=Streptomyces sp. NPDC008240 TaxID=3364822 RepID=UPI0036E6D415